MKRIPIILLSLFLCIQLFAQRVQERRVYYLDCSYSMVKPNKIWDKVCDNLVKAIENVEDETTELVVIPFAVDDQHHAILDAFSQKATSEGKAELKKKICAIVPSTKSMTYHSDPIKDFYDNSRVLNEGITYMFLMTDGQNEEMPDLFRPELRKWQSKYGSKDVYGFYVMLDKSARNETVSDIIDTTNHLWQVETADININLIRFDNNCRFNVRNDDYVDIPVSGQIKNIRFQLSANNQFYKVKDYELNKDFVRIYIEHPDYEESSLPQDETMTILIQSDSLGKYDFLVTENIYVLCHNKIVKGIRPTFNKGKIIEKLGKVTYYPKFLWSEEKKLPLTDTLHLNFNKDAKMNQGFAEFEIVDNDGKTIDDLQVFIDGNKITSNRFIVNCTDDNVVLTFQYDTSAKSGKHQGYLKLVNHNLDQDGDTWLKPSQQNNSLHWQIQYEKKMNPLAKCLMWIGIFIVVSLLIWFVFIKPIKYPTFKMYRKSFLVKQNGNIVYNKTCQFRGARMVVFAAQKEKQSFLNRIFTGRIDTYVSPIFTQKIMFLPKKQGKYGFVRAIGYTIIPNPIPRSGNATIKGNNIEITLS